jgi:hypothetical protein
MIAEPVGRDWRQVAACAAVDPELFYPVDASDDAPAVAVAMRICLVCPVRAECLVDVMAAEDPARRWGVTGGLTPTERTALFVRQRAEVIEAGAVAA